MAVRCWGYALEAVRSLGHEPKELLWVEPSAGAGVFLDTAPAGFDVVGFDIEPRHAAVQRWDFHKAKLDFGRPFAAIGNPPFGYQGTQAAQFITKLLHAGAVCVCFILPATLHNYYSQRRIPRPYGILRRWGLGTKDVFCLPSGSRYKIGGTDFQVWIEGGERALKKPFLHPDYRADILKTCTDSEWECERKNGTADLYVAQTKINGRICTRAELPSENKGSWWIRFWANSPEVLTRLKVFPFDELGLKVQEVEGNYLPCIQLWMIRERYVELYGEPEEAQPKLWAGDNST